MQIFISYRRQDCSASAGRVSDRLRERFSLKRIFIDVDKLGPGDNFVDEIERSLGSCDVLIAVIGKCWLDATDKDGKRRLDNSEDYVRIEIARALQRGIPVIPVLVDDASMPNSQDLPKDLKPLSHLQALKVSQDRFRSDSEPLIAKVEQALKKAKEERNRGKKIRLIVAGVVTALLLVVVAVLHFGWTHAIEEKARRALERATKDQPWVNSIGMRFVPVADMRVLFSVWDTRVQDFEAFVAATNYDATGGMMSIGKGGWTEGEATWREPGFSQGPTHPVVGVSWNDAKKFCEWLTRREQGSGMLPHERIYRLPTDAEWSVGVGLQGEEGTNPIEKNGKIELYPWGKEWPPPKGAGNYAGEEAKTGNWPARWSVIEGYNDGYPRTSPVGSFAPNGNGLYDMGGNVWQWCEDRYFESQPYRVVRGASWNFPNSSNRNILFASFRDGGNIPESRLGNVGFRCVVAVKSSR